MGSVPKCMMVRKDLTVLTVFYVCRIYKFLIRNVIFTSFEIILHLRTPPNYDAALIQDKNWNTFFA